MKQYVNPAKAEWLDLIRRPELDTLDLSAIVGNVFQDVKINGDLANSKYTQQFDRVEIDTFKVSQSEFDAANLSVSEELKSAIDVAISPITTFHASQLEKSTKIETVPGVECWRVSRGIEKVGIYIPGGSAPLFSTVLMLGIPAKLAGCKEIVLCSPPTTNETIHPAILYAAQQVGITQCFKVGGVQAIASLTFGTESIPQVNKIFGPGNQYVTAAKQLATTFGVAIDMPAGPSELLVVADESAVPAFVAADLLSQAEHGADSQVILVSDSQRTVEAVLVELENQVAVLPRQEIARKALENSNAIVLDSIDSCIDFSNAYAPEHLILAIKSAENKVVSVLNAGSIFLGNYSCESAGDYASGTNHTLPTNGYARNYSGVSVDSFVKKITVQNVSEKGIQAIGPAIEVMAEAEQLMAHKNAVTVRLKSLNS